MVGLFDSFFGRCSTEGIGNYVEKGRNWIGREQELVQPAKMENTGIASDVRESGWRLSGVPEESENQSRKDWVV